MNILITGAASGIGLSAAELFASKCHNVFSLDLKAAEERGEKEGGKIRSFVADITDEESLLKVKKQLTEEKVELDAILCIAGMHTMQALTEADASAIKRIVDVNIFGTMLSVRIFHSLLKKCGRILITSSEVATYTPMPFNGLYNVTKTAIDCYSDALRQELNLLGQKVITVRPGAVNTPLSGGSLDSTELLAEKTVLYKSSAYKFSTLVKRFMGKPIEPEKFAKTLYRATTARHPKLSYSKNRNPGLVLLSLLPKRIQLSIIKMLLK